MQPTATRAKNALWHNEPKNAVHGVLGTVFTSVRDDNEWRVDADEYHSSLYQGTTAGGVRVRSRRDYTYAACALPNNVCAMAVDTLQAKIATVRPIPQVTTQRGNWKNQRRARKMRQLIDGEFYRNRVHEKVASQIIKDALVVGRGHVKVYVPPGKKKPRPTVKRLLPWEVYHDDWDAHRGEPFNIYHCCPMDRSAALNELALNEKKTGYDPVKKAAIESAGRFTSQTSMDEESASTVDQIEVLEAWHRCDNHDPDDDEHECNGRHVIIVQGATLVDEPWTGDAFPIVSLNFKVPMTGVVGTGLVEALEGHQYNINEANEKLAEQYRNSGKAVILRDGSGVFDSHILNGVRVLHCRPGPYDPVVFDMDLVNEHLRMRPRELVEDGLNEAGISQMSAFSTKPKGDLSGLALQTLDDVETQRFLVFGRQFESWCLDVARLIVDCIKQIADEFGEYTVRVPIDSEFLDLNWADVEIDGYELKMENVGQLFMSFTGRLDRLKALFEAGAIDKATFLRQLDNGDIQAELDLETVDKLVVDEMIEAMLDAEESDGEDGYKAPTPYIPLQWAHRRAHQRLLQAEMGKAPEYVKDYLTRFIDDCEYLIGKAAPPANDNVPTGATPPGADPAMVDPTMPPGGPMAPPPGDPNMMPPPPDVVAA